MKQIVDKLNKIARAIDESVELSDSDLIIDSLDSITKALGGTPNNSKLIVDKLDTISKVAHSGEVEKHYVILGGTYTSAQMFGMYGIAFPDLYFFAPELYLNLDGVEYKLKGYRSQSGDIGFKLDGEISARVLVTKDFNGQGVFWGSGILVDDTEPTAHKVSAYYLGQEAFWQIISVSPYSEKYIKTCTTISQNAKVYSDYIDVVGRNTNPIMLLAEENGYGTLTVPFFTWNLGGQILNVKGCTNYGEAPRYEVNHNEGNLVYYDWIYTTVQ